MLTKPGASVSKHPQPEHLGRVEEINQKYIEDNGIKVVRRTSDRGAVYHDHGKLNFSFPTTPAARRRKSNTPSAS